MGRLIDEAAAEYRQHPGWLAAAGVLVVLGWAGTALLYWPAPAGHVPPGPYRVTLTAPAVTRTVTAPRLPPVTYRPPVIPAPPASPAVTVTDTATVSPPPGISPPGTETPASATPPAILPLSSPPPSQPGTETLPP